MFDVKKSLKYEKPGQYGDDQATTFHFSMTDKFNDAEPEEHQKEQMAFRELISHLSPGDHVLLNWRHDYVHRTHTENGQEYKSSSPERPITKLEKISQESAEKL